MRKLHTAYAPSLFIVFMLSLWGCSPSEQETNEQPEASVEENQSMAPIQEELMAADGWRRGKLRIEVDVHQEGGNSEPGETSVESHWTSSTKVVSEENVMVAEDLRPYVTEGPLADTDALAYEPFTQLEPDANTIQSSQVNHVATWSVSSPEIKGTNQGEFKGVVNRVYLQSLHPSLFGPGYEAYLKIDITGQLKTREVLSADGQAPVTNEIDREATDEIIYSLHPVPNADKLNDYNYLPEGVDEELKEGLTKQHLDMLSLLNQTYQDTLPVQGQIRAGMKSEATKDSLTMTYEYQGNKEVGHAVMMGVNAGMADTSLVKMTIQLTANPYPKVVLYGVNQSY